MKIALISCSKSKQDYSCKACDMYLPSTLFRYSYQYAKKYADRVYILSAKYGLISESTLIEPYDLTLKTMNTSEKNAWSNKVISQLKSEFDLDNDEFMVLAGKDYYGYLLSSIRKCYLPLGNKPQGVRVQFLKNALREIEDEKENINSRVSFIANETQASVSQKNIKTKLATVRGYIEYKTASTKEIKQYIEQQLSVAKRNGAKELTLVSGDNHREMGLKNRFPLVCSAMYSVMRSNDEVISSTPSGMSSTIKIKYYL